MARHSESRRLPYSAPQMFALVSDIESYPEFLPWCSAAFIRRSSDHDDHRLLDADLVISFKLFRERFRSRVHLFHTKELITIRHLDGPMAHMNSRWQFDTCEEGCIIRFEIDYEFSSRALRALISIVFYEAMQRVVSAFENRARHLYGSGAG